jgi:protein-tyrosine phosphatase
MPGRTAQTRRRSVDLQGASNFRDLGGYPTVDGGQTRWGRVYRSDALHRLSPQDLATVKQLGLRTVYDLRVAEERLQAPSALPVGLTPTAVPIGTSLRGRGGRAGEFAALLASGDWGELPHDYLVFVYEDLLEHHAGDFGRLLSHLSRDRNVPALFHCRQGKDRTGLAAALLLSALGVDEATVLDDYELSADYYWSPRRLERLRPKLAEAGIDEAHYLAVFGAPRQVMATVLSRLRAGHGSVEEFLTARAGLSAADLTALRARLVSPQKR